MIINKAKILIISKSKLLQYRIYTNLISFGAEIKIANSINQINKTIFLDDYDLVIINISNIIDIKKLKELGLNGNKTKFLFINTMQISSNHEFKNFLSNDFTDTDIILKTNKILYSSC
jgi:hypothetical protein